MQWLEELLPSMESLGNVCLSVPAVTKQAESRRVEPHPCRAPPPTGFQPRQLLVAMETPHTPGALSWLSAPLLTLCALSPGLSSKQGGR